MAHSIAMQSTAINPVHTAAITESLMRLPNDRGSRTCLTPYIMAPPSVQLLPWPHHRSAAHTLPSI